mgnify:CR=1 FL=1
MSASVPRLLTSTERLKSSRRNFAGRLKGRIFRPFFRVLLVFLPVTGLCGENEKLTIEFESVSYSEATSLYSLAGNWNDKVGSGDDALSFTRLSFGIESGPISLQYIQRADTVYEFANDTARFIYQIENRQDLIPGETYELEIQPKRQASHGIRMGYTTQLHEDVGVSVFFSLLSPSNVLDGEVKGSAVAVAANDYDFDFDSSLVYRDDPLYDRDGTRLTGDGYAVDLFIRYAINERWHMNLDLIDLAGELSISDAPFTVASATSDVKTFDEDGYVVYNPVITGLEGNRDFTYEFDTQAHLALSYLLSNEYSLVVQHHQYKNVGYQELQFVQLGNQRKFSWHLVPEIGAAGISSTTPVFMLGLTADDFDRNKMKYLALDGQYFWLF